MTTLQFDEHEVTGVVALGPGNLVTITARELRAGGAGYTLSEAREVFEASAILGVHRDTDWNAEKVSIKYVQALPPMAECVCLLDYRQACKNCWAMGHRQCLNCDNGDVVEDDKNYPGDSTAEA